MISYAYENTNENRGMIFILEISLLYTDIGLNNDFVLPIILDDSIRVVCGDDILLVIALKRVKYGRFVQISHMGFQKIRKGTKNNSFYNPYMINYILHINGR